MIMFNKGTNYEILKTVFKVPALLLDTLKSKGVLFKISDSSLVLEYNKKTAAHGFETLLGSIIKNPQPKHIVAVNSFVSNFICEILDNTVQEIPYDPTMYHGGVIKEAKLVVAEGKGVQGNFGVLVTDPALTEAMAKEGLSNKWVNTPFKKNFTKPVPATKNTIKDIDSLNKLAPVKLSDAEFLYQKVKGTSSGSIYRVIALSDSLRIAARVHESVVSIRVEGVNGNISSEDSKALGKVGLLGKGVDYMSGHFTCLKCPPKRLIGAVLLDSGIKFLTPIPQISEELFS